MKMTQSTDSHAVAGPQVFDPVSLGILWDRLVSITNEVVEVLVRTSFSTIVRENYDLARS